MKYQTWMFLATLTLTGSVLASNAPESIPAIRAAAEKSLEVLERKTARAWDKEEADTIRALAEGVLAGSTMKSQQPNENQLKEGAILSEFVRQMALTCETYKPVGTHFSKRICQTRRQRDLKTDKAQEAMRDIQSQNIQLKSGG